MKNGILLSLFLFSTICFSQETIKKDTTVKQGCSNEVGINATLLLKQVLNLSNSNLPTLPYDLTYKLISSNNKLALRIGLGITLFNSTVSSTTTSTGLGQSSTGPDKAVPTENKSTNLFYRIGWEKRFAVHGRIVPFAGFDFAGQYGTSKSQSSQVFNDLPNSYNYTRTTDNTTTAMYGGGPVAGIQFFLTKKLSLYTEFPMYFFYSSQTEVTDSYNNRLDPSFGNSDPEYISSDDVQTQTTKGTKLSISLPVTFYLALKF